MNTPTTFDVTIVAICFFFVGLFLLFLPDVIAKARGVKLKSKAEFGAGEEEILFLPFVFLNRMWQACTASKIEENFDKTEN